jgi:hypothetical protein
MGGGKSKRVSVPVYPAITGPMVAQMVERANQASQNVGVPTLAELFPYMSQNPFLGMQQGTIPTNNMMGAGRFLGQGMTGMTQAPQQNMFGYNPQQSAMLNALMSPGMSMATPQFSFNAPTINK